MHKTYVYTNQTMLYLQTHFLEYIETSVSTQCFPFTTTLSCKESQSCSITQLNDSNPTPDNSTQITIALGTYTYVRVDWSTLLKTLSTLTLFVFP